MRTDFLAPDVSQSLVIGLAVPYHKYGLLFCRRLVPAFTLLVLHGLPYEKSVSIGLASVSLFAGHEVIELDAQALLVVVCIAEC